jgi:hypothetical protein
MDSNLILADSLTACWMLQRALEGDRSNKMATKDSKESSNDEKENYCVGISGNEKSDEFAKKRTTDGTSTQYKLQLKDLYRQIDKNLLENWNGWISILDHINGEKKMVLQH